MKTVLTLSCLLVVLVSCGDKKKNNMDANGPLAGEFIVQSVQGKVIPENFEVNFALDTLESKVSGKSACNNFFGAYLSEGEELSFAKLAGTMMACPEEQMELEQQFLSSMELVGSYRWKNEKLELLDAEDQSVLIVASANAKQ